MKNKILLILSLTLFFISGYAQLLDDFNSGSLKPNWNFTDGYSLNIEDQALKVDIDFNSKNQSFSYAFSEPVDILTTEGISLKINADKPLYLYVRYKNINGDTTDYPLNNRIILPGGYLSYTFEYTPIYTRDPSDPITLDEMKNQHIIDEIIFCVHDDLDSFTGTIYFDDFGILFSDVNDPSRSVEEIAFIRPDWSTEQILLVQEYYRLIRKAILKSPKKAKEILETAKELVEENEFMQTYSFYFHLLMFGKDILDKTDLDSLDLKKEIALYGVTENIRNEWINLITTLNLSSEEDIEKLSQFMDENEGLKDFGNLIFLGRLYEGIGNYEMAKILYYKALTIGTDKDRVEHSSASPEMEEAVDEMDNSVLEFKSFSSYEDIIMFLVREGELNNAEQIIEKFRKNMITDFHSSGRNYQDLLETQIELYFLSGDYQNYMKSWKTYNEFLNVMLKLYLQPCPSYYETYYYSALGNAFEILEQYDKAEKIWLKIDTLEYKIEKCKNELKGISDVPSEIKMSAGREAFNRKRTPDMTKPSDVNLNRTYRGDGSPIMYREEKDDYRPSIDYKRDYQKGVTEDAYWLYLQTKFLHYIRAWGLYRYYFTFSNEWLQDMNFTYGEGALTTFYDTKLRIIYDDYNSFVISANIYKSEFVPRINALAYNNLLFTKSLAFRGSQKRKEFFKNSNSPQIKEHYDNWIKKKRILVAAYQKESDTEKKTEEQDTLDIEALQKEVNALENRLVRDSRMFRELLMIEQPDWTEIRDKLKEGEAAVEIKKCRYKVHTYYSDTLVYLAYIIKKDSKYPELAIMPRLTKELEDEYLYNYTYSIHRHTEDPTTYDQFWKPIADKLKGINTIYFSGDGVYHLINLSTLKNPSTGNYLLEEINIKPVITTGELLSERQEDHSIRSTVLIGRPSYEIDPDKIALMESPSGQRSFVRFFRNAYIADLPGTETEVQTISELLKNQNVRVENYLNEQATEEVIYNIKNPDIFHMATHGFWPPTLEVSTPGFRMINSMMNSGLLLAGVVNYYSEDNPLLAHDGILTAYEAMNLELDSTELVVLSACETGLGQVDAGEGVYGLKRAFKAAGASSVITSLWKVADEPTMELMVLFYKNYFTTGNKFDAFQKAQLELKKKYPQPYYWGAFVMTGI